MAGVVRVLCAAVFALSLTACGERSFPEESAQVPTQRPSVLNSNPSLLSLAHAEPETLAAADRDNIVGAATFRNTCALCHGPGIVGAPRMGDRDAWAPRLARGREALYRHAVEGFRGDYGQMPARGGNPSLSDDEVRAAVDYIVTRTAAEKRPAQDDRGQVNNPSSLAWLEKFPRT